MPDDSRCRTPSRAARPDAADTVLVLTDSPAPDRSSMRRRNVTERADASRLAAAALEDTLAALEGAQMSRYVVMGDDGRDAQRHRLAGRGFTVIEQPRASNDARGAAAFAAVAALEGPRSKGSRPRARLLVGPKTPQVSAGLLKTSWDGADAALGLSEDGGCWAVGLRADVDPRACVVDVAHPRPRSGAAQLNRLVELGLSVALLPPLRHIGRAEDAAVIAYQHSELLFAATHRHLSDQSSRYGVDRLFDHGYAGHPLLVQQVGAQSVSTIDVSRWTSPADDIDQLVVARCEGPVLDLGCGPGRLVRALTESGVAALGVDISAEAVKRSMRAGAPALRARLEDPLPGEGRWGTVLLIDGNVGIGGNVFELLKRCRSLVAPGGLIVCEVDPAPERHENADALLHSRGMSSALTWSRIGAIALSTLAARLDLWVAEEWSAGGRVFVALRRSS